MVLQSFKKFTSTIREQFEEALTILAEMRGEDYVFFSR